MKNLNLSEQLKALIIGLVAAVLIEFLPSLEPLRDSLTEILFVFAAYILGKSGENAVKAHKSA